MKDGSGRANGTFRIVSLNVSDRKGVAKLPVGSLDLVEGMGASGDAHAAPGDRQISLLGIEDIEAFRARGHAVAPGSFAENITTEGVDLASLPIGTRIEIGRAVLELSRIGKECHEGCAIRREAGDCIMPRRGVFARVLVGGRIGLEDSCRYRL
jgi:molybdopterin adenylyltransferase